MASVELQSVTKVFGQGRMALGNVNLTICDGELLVLLGPNGSGKTTILRLIAGLDRPTSGVVLVGGESAERLSPHQRDVAMVFQGCVLFPHLTVEQNIAFGINPDFGGWKNRILDRLSRRVGVAGRIAKSQSVRERVRRTAQLLGIEHLLDRLPRQLSGGERQRAALGRAFVRQPAVFLLDEPLSQADARSRRWLRCELRQMQQQNRCTMIVVTHDHAEAVALADRLAVIDQGRVHQVGTPDELADWPRTRFVGEFVGSPPMSFVAGRCRGQRGGWCFESGCGRLENLQLGSRAGAALERIAGQGGHRDVWLGFRADAATVRNRPPEEGETTGWLCAEVTGSENVAGTSYLLLRPASEDGANEGQCSEGQCSEGQCSEGQCRRAGQDRSRGVWMAKADGVIEKQPGARVQVRLDASRLHVFDRNTGESLMKVV